jgi:hypothetical protein
MAVPFSVRTNEADEANTSVPCANAELATIAVTAMIPSTFFILVSLECLVLFRDLFFGFIMG